MSSATGSASRAPGRSSPPCSSTWSRSWAGRDIVELDRTCSSGDNETGSALRPTAYVIVPDGLDDRELTSGTEPGRRTDHCFHIGRSNRSFGRCTLHAWVSGNPPYSRRHARREEPRRSDRYAVWQSSPSRLTEKTFGATHDHDIPHPLHDPLPLDRLHALHPADEADEGRAAAGPAPTSSSVDPRGRPSRNRYRHTRPRAPRVRALPRRRFSSVQGPRLRQDHHPHTSFLPCARRAAAHSSSTSTATYPHAPLEGPRLLEEDLDRHRAHRLFLAHHRHCSPPSRRLFARHRYRRERATGGGVGPVRRGLLNASVRMLPARHDGLYAKPTPARSRASQASTTLTRLRRPEIVVARRNSRGERAVVIQNLGSWPDRLRVTA